MDAVIDIGSNSVRLCFIVGDVSPKTPNTTFLAEGLAQNGVLLESAIERTAQAVAQFCQMAQLADNVYVFATEAVRSASNGNVLCERIFALTGKKVHVINGEEEAKCGFMGATSGRGGCVVDLGGASIEMIEGSQEITYCKSIPFGVRKAFDTCSFDRQATHEYYASALKNFPKANLPVIGIGGTIVTLSALKNEFKVYDTIKNHGTILTLEDLKKLEDEIYSYSSYKELALSSPILDEKRALVLGTGCIAFVELLSHLGKDSLVVSEADNCEGYYKVFVKNA